MLLSSPDASPWSQAIWGRYEGRVCDCAQRVMSAVSPQLLSDLSLEDIKMLRNPLALLHVLMLERRVGSHCPALHGLGGSNAASISCDHLCFVFNTH